MLEAGATLAVCSGCCLVNASVASPSQGCGRLLLGRRMLFNTCSRRNFVRRTSAWCGATGMPRKEFIPAIESSLDAKPRLSAALHMHAISCCSTVPRFWKFQGAEKRPSRMRSHAALSASLNATALVLKKPSPRCTVKVTKWEHSAEHSTGADDAQPS